MFYDTRKNDHGLPHNPFKDRRASPDRMDHFDERKGEINLAPYSFSTASPTVRRS
jgi:hypothetical protein